MKRYSLAYWIKQTCRYASRPEKVIVAMVTKFKTAPEQCEVCFDGSPLELLNEAYLELKKKNSVHACLFPTPLPVARMLADFADVSKKDVVFDPGCGMGNLLQAAMERGARAFGVDIQDWLAESASITGLDIQAGDYLNGYQPGKFTVALMNPPFGNLFGHADVAIKFLDRIESQSYKGTRVAAILPRHFIEQARTSERVATLAKFVVLRRQALPSGTFKPLTNIETEMVLFGTKIRAGDATVARIIQEESRAPKRQVSHKVLARQVIRNIRKAADEFEQAVEFLPPPKTGRDFASVNRSSAKLVTVQPMLL